MGHLKPDHRICRWSDDENSPGWNTIDLRRIDALGMGVKFPEIFTLFRLYHQCKEWIAQDPARSDAVFLIGGKIVTANCWFGLVVDSDMDFKAVPTFNPARKIDAALDEINQGPAIDPANMSSQYAKLVSAVAYWEVVYTTNIFLLGGKLWTLDSIKKYVSEKLSERLTNDEDRTMLDEHLPSLIVAKNAVIPGVDDNKHFFVICKASSIERIIDAVVASLFS